MCMEDVRIDRQKGSTMRQISASGGEDTLVGGDLKRVAIVVATPDGGNAFLMPLSQPAAGRGFNRGIPLKGGQDAVVWLRIEEYGSLVREPWVVYAGAGVQITVVETSVPLV